MAIAVIGMQDSADLILSAAQSHPRPNLPLFLTSANGEVLSRYARDPAFARIMTQADLVHADGQPMVVASRLMGEHALPERVATTDLFHSVARGAVDRNITFYLFGSSEEENLRAVENVRRLHPGLRIVGHSHGYLQGDALRAKIHEIDGLAPDILWLALGVPREQLFVYEFAPLLTNVGLIKTSGGLFNFLSGSRTRAPDWMQRFGLEWLWRIKEEPTRLFWRYLTTNPHAMLLLIARSDGLSTIGASLRRLLRSSRHGAAAAAGAIGPDVPVDADRSGPFHPIAD
ncbi:MAG: WecB/TagA/CpsF family glycosyltransferase [Methylobacterium sp.]